MIKLVGIVLIMASAVGARVFYARFIGRSEEGCAAFLCLLEHIEVRVGCYLEPVNVWSHSFECEALERGGFLERLRSGDSLHRAYDLTRVGFSLPKEADELLCSCFSGFGRGYREEELRALGRAKDELIKIIEKEKGENEKRIRVVTAVIISVCLGVVLLLL